MKKADALLPEGEGLRRLTRDGYILGYEALQNPLKLGRGMMVFVEVLLDRTTPNVFEAFKAAVRRANELIARIEDGLLASDVRDGALTALDLAPGVAP